MLLCHAFNQSTVWLVKVAIVVKICSKICLFMITGTKSHVKMVLKEVYLALYFYSN